MKSIFIITIFLSQMAFAQQEVSQRLAEIEKSRADLEGVLDQRSYSEKDQTIIKAYFNALNLFESDLSNYSKYRKRFNSYVRSVQVQNFCAGTFLDLGRWNNLVSNCTKNDYFLCSDDVITFSDTKKKLSANLDSDLKGEFDKSNKCK